MSNNMTCPNCGAEIELDSMLASEREKMHHDLEADMGRRIAEELKAKDEEFETRKEAIALAASEKAKQEAAESMLEDKARLEELEQKLSESRAKELDMFKREQALKDEKADLELELQKRLSTATEEIRKAEAARIQEEVRLKEAQKDKVINDLMSQVEDLKRKAEQGSQQLQGEVLELELEALLRQHFPLDVVEPVPTGTRGADVIQTVRSRTGQTVGKIVWESKQAKLWAKDWVTKLKEDTQKIGAELSVIYTTVLPKEIKNFGQVEGVWVTDHQSVLGLTNVLRSTLEEIDLVKRANEGGQEKAAQIYEYIQSPQFRQKVQVVIETAEQLRDNLNRERRALEKIWKERERYIDKVVNGLSGTYGELTAISGGTLEAISSLEFELNEKIDASEAFDDELTLEEDVS